MCVNEPVFTLLFPPGSWHPSARGGISAFCQSFILWVVMLSSSHPQLLHLCNHDCVYCLDSGVVSYSAPHPLENGLMCPPLSGISPVLNFKANQYLLLHKHGSTLSPNTPPENGNLLLNLFNIQSHRKSEGHTQVLHHCFPETTHYQASGEVLGNTQASRSSGDQCCWWALWITTC